MPPCRGGWRGVVQGWDPKGAKKKKKEGRGRCAVSGFTYLGSNSGGREENGL